MLSGKTAIVTGSTSGIGLGIAEALAGQGANIVLNGFGEAVAIEELRSRLSRDHNVGVSYSAADISKPDEIADMYSWEGHLGLVVTGCSHLTATPKITVDGDDAQAVGYSFVVLREGERWFLWRAAINHWTLRRTAEGWRIAERTNRTLNGSEDSLELMRKVAAI